MTIPSRRYPQTVNKLREMSPLWEMYKEGIDLNTIGGRIIKQHHQSHYKQTIMAYSDKKVLDHYQNPKILGTLDKSKQNVGTGLVSALPNTAT